MHLFENALHNEMTYNMAMRSACMVTEYNIEMR